MDSFTDIHCHLIPGIDDGAKSIDESIQMAKMAVADGIHTIIATPHQLGSFVENRGDTIREQVATLQRRLHREEVPLTVLPGADVRIDSDMLAKLISGEVLTLGDHGKHVLLELPHEMYFPLQPVLDKLHQAGFTGILSHPERNLGILKQPQVLAPLVEQGCLMQVTAGSLLGGFGGAIQQFSEKLVRDRFVHFLATDAHGVSSRRPLMRRAFRRVAELTDETTAIQLCCQHPRLVACGEDIILKPHRVQPVKRSGWFGWRKTG